MKQITSDALERPESERPSWLAGVCAGDEALRREVESLLRAHARAGQFLETPGLAEAGAAEVVVTAALQGSLPIAAGRSIGPYRIIRELGQGGMGVVYLAERADAVFEKKAAIKVVRGGFASASLMERFRDERRILATLDHPNIARLLDGGATDDGWPYFVMEYVDGIPLDAYCAPLSLAQRLALFRQVCETVQYAHQRLVIHRDLKARNILVTADGTPKLLDFGIAKLLEPGLAPEEQTRTGFRALTLEGASPEQVRGEPMTVTSDVYSLGALLYRLLTGQSPYGAAQRNDVELMRAICDEAPARPSAVAPIGRQRELSGDLDWIVLKALRKEPDRRYASVEQFAEDIGRHLSGRPVMAAPDSWRYRARKFAVRHRAVVAAGVLLTSSLLAGLTTTLWQARQAEEQRARAERRFNDVRALANAFIHEIHDGIEKLPGSTPVRAALVARSLQYLDSLASEAAGDSSLQRELAAAYQKVGDVQGGPASANLGDLPGAVASYRKALAIRERLAAAPGADTEDRRSLAGVSLALGEALGENGDAHAEDEMSRKALAIYEALAAADPASIRARGDLAWAHLRMGRAAENVSGGDALALDSYRRAAEIYEDLIDAEPADRRHTLGLARAYQALGRVVLAGGDLAGLEVLRKAVSRSEEHVSADPNDAVAQYELSFRYRALGDGLSALGDLTGALESHRKALELRKAVLRGDPAHAAAAQALARSYKHVGQVLVRSGDLAAALASFREAVAGLERMARADPSNVVTQGHLAETYADLGTTYRKRAERGLTTERRLSDWREARAWFERSATLWRQRRERGALRSYEAQEPERIAAAIAACDGALAKLAAARGRP